MPIYEPLGTSLGETGVPTALDAGSMSMVLLSTLLGVGIEYQFMLLYITAEGEAIL